MKTYVKNLFRLLLITASLVFPNKFKRLLLLTTAILLTRPKCLDDDVLAGKINNLLGLAKDPIALTTSKPLYKWIEVSEFDGVLERNKTTGNFMESLVYAILKRCPAYLRYGSDQVMAADLKTALTAATTLSASTV